MPMRILTIAAWVLFALEVILVGGMFFQRNMGDDAAGRGMARGFAMILAPILLAAGALFWWGGHSHVRPAYWIGLLLIASPVILGAASGTRGKLRSWNHALGRAQYGRFGDARLSKAARAIDRKDLPGLQAILARGPVDFGARDRREHTILGHAVMRVLGDYGDAEAPMQCVRVLLAAGAPPDRRALATERTSYAPEDYELIAAVFGGNSPGVVPLLDALLEAGADPNVDDMFDEPLIFSSYASVPKLEALARHGADLRRLHTRSDRKGWTALMNAAYVEEWEQAEFFLAHGVPVDHEAPDGQSLRTVLDEWARQQRESGADPEAVPGYRRLREALGTPRPVSLAAPPRGGRIP
jgi:hypothetical protein